MRGVHEEDLSLARLRLLQCRFELGFQEFRLRLDVFLNGLFGR